MSPLPPLDDARPMMTTPAKPTPRPISSHLVSRSWKKNVASSATMIGPIWMISAAVPASIRCSDSFRATL